MSWTRRKDVGPVLHASAGSTLDEDAILTSLTERLVKTIEDHPANLLSELDAASDDRLARRGLIEEIAAGTTEYRMDWTSASRATSHPPIPSTSCRRRVATTSSGT